MTTIKEYVLNCNVLPYKDKEILVSQEDYDLISNYKWYALKGNKLCNTFYAYTHPKKKENPIAMHRLIMGNPKLPKIIDHKNMNGLDNRRTNIRICTYQQNKINIIKYKTNSSGFTGVVWDKSRKKWVARIRVHNKLIHLGRFNDKLSAIEARYNKVKELYGEEFINNKVKMEVQKMKKLTEYASGNFLKAVNVESDKDAFVVTEAEEAKANDGREALRLTLERNGVEYEFDLNKTNIKFLVTKGFIEPMTLVSKKLFFKKALVRNPKTNMEVEGLRICDVQ